MRFPAQWKSWPIVITWVASEYGVRESLFTSNDPNMIDTPEELEGLSCCVGTIFGPVPKELHFTSIEQRRQVGDSHHNPASRLADERTRGQSLSRRSPSLLVIDLTLSRNLSLNPTHLRVRRRQIRWFRGARMIQSKKEKKKARDSSLLRSRTRDVRPKGERFAKNYEST